MVAASAWEQKPRWSQLGDRGHVHHGLIPTVWQPLVRAVAIRLGALDRRYRYIVPHHQVMANVD
jgi:hypothetical protein